MQQKKSNRGYFVHVFDRGKNVLSTSQVPFEVISEWQLFLEAHREPFWEALMAH